MMLRHSVMMNFLVLFSVLSAFMAHPVTKSSENFYLVAYKIPDVTAGDSDLFRAAAPLLNSGFQPLALDGNNVVVDTTISTKVGGVINPDLSMELGYDGNLTQNYLAFSEDDILAVVPSKASSLGHFSIFRGDLQYDEDSEWRLCQKSNTTFVTLRSYNECDAHLDVVIRTYGFNAGGGIPDYPL